MNQRSRSSRHGLVRDTPALDPRPRLNHDASSGPLPTRAERNRRPSRISQASLNRWFGYSHALTTDTEKLRTGGRPRMSRAETRRRREQIWQLRLKRMTESEIADAWRMFRSPELAEKPELRAWSQGCLGPLRRGLCLSGRFHRRPAACLILWLEEKLSIRRISSFRSLLTPRYWSLVTVGNFGISSLGLLYLKNETTAVNLS